MSGNIIKCTDIVVKIICFYSIKEDAIGRLEMYVRRYSSVFCGHKGSHVLLHQSYCIPQCSKAVQLPEFPSEEARNHTFDVISNAL